MIFLGFEKYRDSAQNSKELVFDFTKKKTFVHHENKPKFHPHEAHILSQLDVSVLYINVYGFRKILSFGSKPKGVSHRFYQKIVVRNKN
jgi:hypothetical protein